MDTWGFCESPLYKRVFCLSSGVVDMILDSDKIHACAVGFCARHPWGSLHVLKPRGLLINITEVHCSELPKHHRWSAVQYQAWCRTDCWPSRVLGALWLQLTCDQNLPVGSVNLNLLILGMWLTVVPKWKGKAHWYAVPAITQRQRPKGVISNVIIRGCGKVIWLFYIVALNSKLVRFWIINCKWKGALKSNQVRARWLNLLVDFGQIPLGPETCLLVNTCEIN